MLCPGNRNPGKPPEYLQVCPRGRALATATVACRQESGDVFRYPPAEQEEQSYVPRPQIPTYRHPLPCSRLELSAYIKAPELLFKAPVHKVIKPQSSGHGVCSSGVCQCEPGWAGEAAVTSCFDLRSPGSLLYMRRLDS